MRTARHSSGQWQVYNDAVAVKVPTPRHPYWRLMGKGGRWVADVPEDWVIESQRPCEHGHDAKPPPMTLAAAIEIVAAGIEDAEWLECCHLLPTLKRKLSRFDARTKQFRD